VPQRILAEPAISIDDNDYVWRIVTQMPHTEFQRITFATVRRIRTNYRLHSYCPDNRGSIIRTIIRNDEDAVTGPKLRLNVPDGGKYPRPLVMGRNKDDGSVTQRGGRHNWRTPLLT
jgi:hypothetical protein